MNVVDCDNDEKEDCDDDDDDDDDDEAVCSCCPKMVSLHWHFKGCSLFSRNMDSMDSRNQQINKSYPFHRSQVANLMNRVPALFVTPLSF